MPRPASASCGTRPVKKTWSRTPCASTCASIAARSPEAGGLRFGLVGDALLRRSRAAMAGRIDEVAPPGPVLDVGAGEGTLIDALRAKGYELTSTLGNMFENTIAMARTSDPDSATAQFFINTVDNDRLSDPVACGGAAYAVFGKVVEGTAVVDKIKAVATGNKGPHQNVPNTPVTITSATVVK